MRLKWLSIASVLLLCAVCGAESRCPWLNDATAAGGLNGPVTLEVNGSAEIEKMCVFRNRTGTSTLSLQIVVRESRDTAKDAKFYQSQCTSSTVPLRAIGNEAASCAIDASNSRGEQVIGRVRDQLFVVAIRAGRRNTPPVKREMLQESAESVSESVAGALF